MADNILRGIIKIEAPGVVQTTNQVASSVAKVEQSFKRLTPTTNSANLALLNTGRVVQDLPFGFLGIANNLNPLLESFQRLKAETGSTKTALQSLGKSLIGPGGLGFALSIVSTLMIVFGDRIFGTGRAAKKAKEDVDEYKKAVDGIFGSIAKEAAETSSLVAILKNETETRERKLSAIKELQRISPEIFSQLKLEGDAVIGLDIAYKSYLENLKTVIAAKIKQVQLESAIEKLLRLQGVTLTANEKIFQQSIENIRNFLSKDPTGQKTPLADKFKEEREKAAGEIKALEADIAGLIGDITELSKGIKVPELKVIPKKLKIETAGDIEISAKGVEAEIELPVRGVLKEGSAGGFGGDIGKLGTAMQESFIKTAQIISGFITPAISEMIDAIGKGENAFKAFGNAVLNIMKAVAQKIIETAILAGILSAITGGASGGGVGFFKAFTSLLGGGNGFNGAGIGGLGLGGGGQVQFVLRGQDLYGSMAATGRVNGRLGG